jgi:hypothetical protein
LPVLLDKWASSIAVAAGIFDGATEQGAVDAIAKIAVALSVAKKWRLNDEVIWVQAFPIYAHPAANLYT